MLAAERRVSLEVERLRAEDFWRGRADDFIPLPVAAAIAFHQADGSSKATVTVDDYERALNLAACALSRLIAVHAGGTAIDIDLSRQRFAHGATELRGTGGVIESLSVRRTELVSALSFLKRTGWWRDASDSDEGGPGASARRP